MTSIHEQRGHIAALIDPNSAVDAPTAYYALYHDPNRSALYVKDSDAGHAVGFIGRFQTGIDLFRPVIVSQCKDAETAAELLTEACVIGRPYLFFSGLNQLPL